MRATSEFQLLLTYSTSFRHGGQAKAGSVAPLAHTVFCKWSVASRPCYGSLQATRLSLQLFGSCIVASFAVQTSATAGQERLTIHAGKRNGSPRSQPI